LGRWQQSAKADGADGGTTQARHYHYLSRRVQVKDFLVWSRVFLA